MRKLIISGILSLIVVACTQKEAEPAKAPEADLGVGIGPVKSLTLENEIKKSLVDQGQQIFASKCSACHKIDERYVGPSLKGVTHRRKPEWIMNMILNPQEMIQKDPTAQELLGEFLVQMTLQNLNQDEARAILEYFRSIDGNK